MEGLKRFVRINRRICRRLTERYPDFFAGESQVDDLLESVERALQEDPGEVLEVGGIDRPLLKKSPAFHYVGMDIEEKAACHEIYDRFIAQSIEESVGGAYGMVISMTLLEHVQNNRAAIRNIFYALEPGGSTHHYVPSKHHPYSVCTRMVGPRLQRKLISMLRPEQRTIAETGYPAFFDHCTPSAMRRLMEDVGFRDVRVKCVYRANDYFAFLVPAFVLVSAFENFCRRVGWSVFASGFAISARRPEDAGAWA